jgi:homoserine kinase
VGSDSEVEKWDIMAQVQEAASKRILFLPHAVSQMITPERMISTQEVRAVLFHGVVIEDYPEDARGHSCLMLGWGEEDRPLHVVCAPKTEYLAVITTYLPSPKQWEPDWRTRRKR